MMWTICKVTFLFVVVCISPRVKAAPYWRQQLSSCLTLSVDMSTGMPGGYNLTSPFDTRPWLVGRAPAVYCDHTWYSTTQKSANDTLVWRSAKQWNGTDGIGEYLGLSVDWQLGSSSRHWQTNYVVYPAIGALRFQQVFPTGCPQANVSALPTNTSSSPHSVTEFQSATKSSSRFPSFQATNETLLGSTLGYITWTGRFMHDRSSHGVGLKGYNAGAEGGPLVLFDTSVSEATPTLVLSSFDEFMVGISSTGTCEKRRKTCPSLLNNTDFYGNDLHSLNTSTVEECCSACLANPSCGAFSYAPPSTPTYGTMCWLKSTAGSDHRVEPHLSGIVCPESSSSLDFGPQGYVQSIPANYNISWIVVPGQGITSTMNYWGATLRSAYKTVRDHSDLVSAYLGYWTVSIFYMNPHLISPIGQWWVLLRRPTSHDCTREATLFGASKPAGSRALPSGDLRQVSHANY